MISVKELVELSKEVSQGDPIDWADLAVDEEQAYTLVAMSVLESLQYMPSEVLLATVTKLTVENMVLNLKLIKVVTSKP